MLVRVGERRVTAESVAISTDEETGRRLAHYLFARATDRPGNNDEDVTFTCTVEGETFEEVIRITGAQKGGTHQYTFQGLFQGLLVMGSFKSSGYTGSISEAP